MGKPLDKLKHIVTEKRSPSTREELDRRIEKASSAHWKKVKQPHTQGMSVEPEVKKPEFRLDLIGAAIDLACVMLVFFYGPSSLPIAWVIWSGIGIGETLRFLFAALLYLSGF